MKFLHFWFYAALALLPALASERVWAQSSYETNITTTQWLENFNELGANHADDPYATPLPGGWVLAYGVPLPHYAAPLNAPTIFSTSSPHSFTNQVVPENSRTLIWEMDAAWNPTTTSGGSADFGDATTGETNRAVGFGSSSPSWVAPTNYLMFGFTNGTGQAITNVALNYNIKQYNTYAAITGAHLFYSTDGTNWNHVGGSDVGPFPTSVAAVYLYSTGPYVSNVVVTINNLNVARGSPFYLAWQFVVGNASGIVGGGTERLALDDVSLSFNLNLLAFAAQPASVVAGNTLANFTVQLLNPNGTSLASNNVPVSLAPSSGTFASGASTVNTGPTGAAVFSNLVITTAGNLFLTASAPGFNPANSSSFTINPAAIDHYSLSVPSTAYVGLAFPISVAAQDIYGNTVTTNSSTKVTLASTTANVAFDGNNNGVFGEPGDNIVTLSSGAFSINAEDNVTETVSLSAADGGGKTGASGSIVVSTNNSISDQAAMLGAFLTSLQVDKYWLVGTSVNWLTGAPGGSGPNMTIGTDSHCSAFAAGAMELLGIYILRPPDASDVNLANNQADWLATNTVGWFAISNMLVAQYLANTGVAVVASYKASSGSGHIAILRPSTRTDASINTYGPEECQSGDFNYADTNIVTGFSEHPGAFPNNILYYGHAVSYPVSPVNVTIGPCQITNQNFTAGITSIVGRVYQLQSSSNLTAWSTLLNFTNSNNSSSFFTTAPLSDVYSAAVAQKYYRVLDQ